MKVHNEEKIIEDLRPNAKHDGARKKCMYVGK
jgi:hypothetical protein